MHYFNPIPEMNATAVLLFIVVIFCAGTDIQLRKPKFWPVWPIGVVRFRNDICRSLEGFDGTCYTKRQCMDSSGINSGSCANGIGQCCIFQVTCGGTATFNNTYVINPSFPNTMSTSTSCTVAIQKCNADICQVRLDFLNLNLAQPDGNGNCVTDSLVITGAASNVPIICGENSGQHIYVNFNGNSDIVIMVSTNGALNYPRSWNIKVTQIGCDCPTLAPTGCLMYYTDLSGTVSSFNYGITLSGSLVSIGNGQVRPGTRQLANVNYGVCVQMQAGYCGIMWSQGSDPTSFTVSGNTAVAAVPPPGLPSDGLSGTNCTTDFVVIPNPVRSDGVMDNSDRFCGNQFPTLVSYSKPFVMTVVTDSGEVLNATSFDIANRGFSLNYVQVACNGISGIMVVAK